MTVATEVGTEVVRTSPLRAVAAPWVVARLLVLATLAVAALVENGLPGTGDIRPSAGLLAWDAGWYRAIAEDGYAAHAPDGVRFFPLLPLLARAVDAVTPFGATVALTSIANVAALAYGGATFALVRRETGDDELARRSTWLTQLFPGSVVLTFGYTEALAGLLAVGFLWFLRDERLGPVGITGFLSGLLRPTGVLLALPGAVGVRRASSQRAGVRARVVGVIAPTLGTAAYLAWSGAVFGDVWLPYRVHTSPDLRGGLVVNPAAALFDGGIHPLLAVALALTMAVTVVVTFVLLRRAARVLPSAHVAWAGAVVVVAVTATILRSLPRYVASAFPILVAIAGVASTRRRWWWTRTACLAGFAAVSYSTFVGWFVP